MTSTTEAGSKEHTLFGSPAASRSIFTPRISILSSWRLHLNMMHKPRSR